LLTKPFDDQVLLDAVDAEKEREHPIAANEARLPPIRYDREEAGVRTGLIAIGS